MAQRHAVVDAYLLTAADVTTARDQHHKSFDASEAIAVVCMG